MHFSLLVWLLRFEWVVFWSEISDYILYKLIYRFFSMEHSFWQLGDELRGQSKVSEDQKWLVAASRLAEQTRSKPERRINLDLSKGAAEFRPRGTSSFQEDNKFESFNFNMLNLEPRLNENVAKTSFSNGIYNMNAVYQNPNISSMGNISGSKYNNVNPMKEPNNSHINNHNNKDENSNGAADKRFKTLPAAETLPRNEVLGGYIFVCNNDTMQEDLKRQLFGNYMIFLANYFPVCIQLLRCLFEIKMMFLDVCVCVCARVFSLLSVWALIFTLVL